MCLFVGIIVLPETSRTERASHLDIGICVRTLSFLRDEIDWLSFRRIGSIHSQDPTGPFMLLDSTQTGHTDLIAKMWEISLE